MEITANEILHEALRAGADIEAPFNFVTVICHSCFLSTAGLRSTIPENFSNYSMKLSSMTVMKFSFREEGRLQPQKNRINDSKIQQK